MVSVDGALALGLEGDGAEVVGGGLARSGIGATHSLVAALVLLLLGNRRGLSFRVASLALTVARLLALLDPLSVGWLRAAWLLVGEDLPEVINSKLGLVSTLISSSGSHHELREGHSAVLRILVLRRLSVGVAPVDDLDARLARLLLHHQLLAESGVVLGLDSGVDLLD